MIFVSVSGRRGRHLTAPLSRRSVPVKNALGNSPAPTRPPIGQDSRARSAGSTLAHGTPTKGRRKAREYALGSGRVQAGGAAEAT